MGAIPYYAYGDLAADNIVKTMTDGPVKITVEILLLLHLVAAYPILTNPPAQYFEQLLNIPSGNLDMSGRQYKPNDFRS